MSYEEAEKLKNHPNFIAVWQYSSRMIPEKNEIGLTIDLKTMDLVRYEVDYSSPGSFGNGIQ